MTAFETKYSIGDVVWLAWTERTRKQHPCPDCLGSRKWTATSPAGASFDVPCPRCGSGYRSNHDMSLDYWTADARARRLTVGSVRVDTNSADSNEYMCKETGIGSGAIHRESSLFPTEAEAQSAAEIMAAHRNATDDRIVKQFNDTLSFSDYQLKDAAIKSAEDAMSRTRTRVRSLFDGLEDCQNISEVREEIERFKQRDASP